jgi:hypothetical protein
MKSSASFSVKYITPCGIKCNTVTNQDDATQTHAQDWKFVYSLEYTRIPKVIFRLHQGRLRQQGNSRANKCNNGIKGKNCTKAIVATM